MDYKKQALISHEEWQGKIEVTCRCPVATKDDLSVAYTPGVAEPCLKISDDVDLSYKYTRRGNLVAVVTDGTAVLGLGDIGPEAGMPVMEGKCVLFKAFGDVDAFPLCVRSKDVDEIVRTIELLAGSFGGINLEDISAPRCFEIERRLKEVCDIPIVHDDQHGTAVVSAAAMIGACRLTKKNIGDLKAVVSGAGAAGPVELMNEVEALRNGETYEPKVFSYQIAYNLEVHNFGDDKDNTVYVWQPEFASSPEQRNTETSSDRKPDLASYHGTSLYTFQGSELAPTSGVYSSAIFQRYKIVPKIDTSDIRRDYDTASEFYRNYTREETLISANASGSDRELKRISTSRNPYIMCRNIYNHLVRIKRDSALEYAMMFTSMARKSGIPARPVCGYLVDSDGKVTLHYWAEFFIMGIGWLPSDPMQKSFAELGSDHVTFSKGIAELPQINPSGQILEPKYHSYALQNIYSEVVGRSDTVAVLWGDMEIISRW